MTLRLLSISEKFLDGVLNYEDSENYFPDNFKLFDLLELQNKAVLSGKLKYRSLSENVITVNDMSKLDRINLATIEHRRYDTQTHYWNIIKLIPDILQRFRIKVTDSNTGEYYGNIGLNWKTAKNHLDKKSYLEFYVRRIGAIFATEETFRKIQLRTPKELRLEKIVFEKPDSTEPSNSD
jgi:hypothetical protein